MIQNITNFYTLTNPLFVGIVVQAILVILVIFGYKTYYNSSKWWLVAYFVEGVYDFFDEVMGPWFAGVKSYVTNLFFIFLLMNLTSLVVDMFKLAFPWLENYISVPTGDIHFPITVAAVSIIYLLVKQVQSHGGINTILEYIPIKGKQLLDSKPGDVALSLFIGLLDIVWLFAKIISLGARMFGNILSGGILAWVVIGGLWLVTSGLLWWIKLPLLIPVVLIAQSLLVSVIQSFVFPLLVAIFIRIASE